MPVCQSNVATCPVLPTIAKCLFRRSSRSEPEQHDGAPSVFVPRPIRTPAGSALLTALGSLLTSPGDLVLTHPPRLLHLVLGPYPPRIASEEQLCVLAEHLGARSMGCLAVKLAPYFDVGVFGEASVQEDEDEDCVCIVPRSSFIFPFCPPGPLYIVEGTCLCSKICLSVNCVIRSPRGSLEIGNRVLLTSRNVVFSNAHGFLTSCFFYRSFFSSIHGHWHLLQR